MKHFSHSILRRLQLAGSRAARFRLTWAWAFGVLRAFVTLFAAFGISLWIMPGQQVARGAESVALLAVVVLLLGALLRPMLVNLTIVTGATGFLVACVLAQATILGIALSLVPSVERFTFTEIVVASWGAAVISAMINWLFDASSEDAYLGTVLGQTVRLSRRTPVTGPGLLVIQLDGVSEPMLRRAINAGAMPTVDAWLRGRTHGLRAWHTGMPATTPAGQATLLHGDTWAVPAFRWYDKKLGTMTVCSQPADLARIEEQLSTGDGLLAHGGVSVSNLFSGDAAERILTASDARLPGSDRGAASYAVTHSGFLRSAVLLIGEVITEWHQARRQRLRNVHPRVRRGGSFLFLRGLTTVLLRDLNVSIVAGRMARGAPVIYVDFVDFDEVAHHAGPDRPESQRTLEGLDRIILFFAELAAEVGRDYEIALVSDHGQSQGATFRQLAGQTLSELTHQLAAVRAQQHDDDVPAETWGPANLLLAGGSRGSGVLSTAVRSMRDRSERTGSDAPVRAAEADRLVVASSGNLAHIYVTDLPGRLDHDRIVREFPRLVTGLAEHPYIGLVMTRQGEALLVAGNDGWREIVDGQIVDGYGIDPMEPYGSHALEDLIALDRRDDIGDIIVLGLFDPVLGEVAAFEELVGSHGGLGGWQTEAFLIHPVGWTLPHDRPLSGLQVHDAMIERLRVMGLRGGRRE